MTQTSGSLSRDVCYEFKEHAQESGDWALYKECHSSHSELLCAEELTVYEKTGYPSARLAYDRCRGEAEGVFLCDFEDSSEDRERCLGKIARPSQS